MEQERAERERLEREKQEKDRQEREHRERLERERRILKESVDSHAAVDQHFSESLRLASQRVIIFSSFCSFLYFELYQITPEKHRHMFSIAWSPLFT